MIKWWRRDRQPALVEAADAASRGGGESVDRLLALLAEVAATGDEAAGRAALAVLADRPRVVVRLDEHARRAYWYETTPAPRGHRVVARMAETPLAVALASTHGDGRVRERAVTAMLSPALDPDTAERLTTWINAAEDRPPAPRGPAR
ncbi:hypothetical protein [Actinoplanes sp. NPDC023714]|uniref:hypothetical protein n=1 Tax=Actinoplanes sp. NPDC023714 TaxID=3154322 RepID=UPI003400772F